MKDQNSSELPLSVCRNHMLRDGSIGGAGTSVYDFDSQAVRGVRLRTRVNMGGITRGQLERLMGRATAQQKTEGGMRQPPRRGGRPPKLCNLGWIDEIYIAGSEVELQEDVDLYRKAGVIFSGARSDSRGRMRKVPSSWREIRGKGAERGLSMSFRYIMSPLLFRR